MFFFNVSKLVRDLILTSNLFYSTVAAYLTGRSPYCFNLIISLRCMIATCE